jgi:hypothetical protein
MQNQCAVNNTDATKSRSQLEWGSLSIRDLYFFFPLPFFAACAEPLDMTLPARDVLADAALLALPDLATISSFLFWSKELA